MIYKNIKINMPKWVEYILDTLNEFDYEAYIVGGCVRDSLLHRQIHDWDITTNALPEEIIEIFESLGYKVIPTGIKHETVTVVICRQSFEITTFRIDGDYSDNRHPDSVTFTRSLKEDLSRRDLTINAMAYNDKEGLIDYFGGVQDIKNKIIRCVGDPSKRFNEDALRMMRAIRFSCQLGFDIEQSVVDAICILNENIKNISKERIRDELCKILVSNNPVDGICHLIQSGLMKNIVPELYDTVNFNQRNIHHDKDVFMHILSVIKNTSSVLELRLAALFHDIGKPKCFTIDKDGQGHFIEHHKISADMTRDILTRLKFDNKTINKVCLLVYEHMIDTKMKKPGIKRLITKVGKDNIKDLIELCIADRKGMAREYQDYTDILELQDRIEEILNYKEPLSVKDLAINGNDLIKLGYKQGKEIGIILNNLLERVLENPELNNKNTLLKIVNERMI